MSTTDIKALIKLLHFYSSTGTGADAVMLRAADALEALQRQVVFTEALRDGALQEAAAAREQHELALQVHDAMAAKMDTLRDELIKASELIDADLLARAVNAETALDIKWNGSIAAARIAALKEAAQVAAAWRESAWQDEFFAGQSIAAAIRALAGDKSE